MNEEEEEDLWGDLCDADLGGVALSDNLLAVVGASTVTFAPLAAATWAAPSFAGLSNSIAVGAKGSWHTEEEAPAPAPAPACAAPPPAAADAAEGAGAPEASAPPRRVVGAFAFPTTAQGGIDWGALATKKVCAPC